MSTETGVAVEGLELVEDFSGILRWRANGVLFEQRVGILSELSDLRYTEEQARAVFTEVLEAVRSKKEEVLTRIAERLLETFNDTWRDEDEAELSREEFLARISLDRITLSEPDNPCRGINLVFRDGGLFGGHQIECPLEWNGDLSASPSLIG